LTGIRNVRVLRLHAARIAGPVRNLHERPPQRLEATLRAAEKGKVRKWLRAGNRTFDQHEADRLSRC
jgi:hypothetical protein